ncbi:AI-2E family transporter [Streptomyces sp. TP-A0874]|uniref:AI-2E family transporter n=1 Tax=Streptomyces sp. TP-A0874 TaxID=549819 RepID=UPI00099FAB92|nr:AI-2E family transporter [Streptomyces sp. TP-A0874]
MPTPPDAEPLLPRGARRVAAWCAVVLLVTAVAAIGVWLCVELGAVVTPVLLAVLGAALLGPLYRLLVRLRLGRSLAAFLTCTALLAVVGGIGYIVVSALIDSGGQIIDSVKRAAQQLSTHVAGTGLSLDDVAGNLKNMATRFGGSAATGLVSGLSVVSQLVATALLALLLTFFFLRDSDRAMRTVYSWVPRHSAPRVEAIARRAFQAVEGFMRGTTLIALIDAVCIYVGLLILRVPGAVGLGALVFVGGYIPYLGAFFSGTAAVLVALADRGFVIALWALGVVLAVQLLEGHVLQPVIQSRTVHMHPALVLLALAAGASLAGILGMLLAVPVAAAGFGIVSELRKSYSDSISDADGPGSASGSAGSSASSSSDNEPPGSGAFS